MRPYVYLILILLVLVVPFALRQGARDRDAPPASGARRLVVVTPNNQDIRAEFARAFSAWHLQHFGQAVDLDYRTPGGTTDIRRLLQTTYEGLKKGDRLPPDASSGIDLVWGGGDYFFGQLRGMGILEPLRLSPTFLRENAFPDARLAGVPLYDYDPKAWERIRYWNRPGAWLDGLPSCLFLVPRTSSEWVGPRWVGTCLSSFGIVYNPDLYQHALRLPPPTTWADLARPELAGWLALADPTHSGSAGQAYLMVVQRAMADAEGDVFSRRPGLKALLKAPRLKPHLDAFLDPKAAARGAPAALPAGEQALLDEYRAAVSAGWRRGMGQLLLIAANARYFSDSATLPPQDVANGEAAAGTAIDFYGRVYEDAAGPGRCRVVMPAAATAITPDPIAVLRGAPDRELAERFVAFLLTPEAQRLWDLQPGTPGGPRDRSLRRLPIRRDAYADRTGWADPDADPFRDAGEFNQRQEWTGLFTDLMPLWAAAWIDSNESLRRAHAAILAVPDPARRAKRLAQLGEFPVTMGEVYGYAAERNRRAAGHEDVEIWRASQRIDWARRCREHYEAAAAGREIPNTAPEN